ncbi:hypothetical protein [Kitasatospora sp. HPMI-4]
MDDGFGARRHEARAVAAERDGAWPANAPQANVEDGIEPDSIDEGAVYC